MDSFNSGASLTNVLVVLTVLICIWYWIYYLIRHGGPAMWQSESVVRWTPQQAAQVALSPLDVPFSVELIPAASSTASEQSTEKASLRLRCSKAFHLLTLWRVPFRELGRILGDVSAADRLVYQGETQRYGTGEHVVPVARPSAKDADTSSVEVPAVAESGAHAAGSAADTGGAAAPAPVQHYPLVVVVEAEEPADSPADVVALVAVVHLRSARAAMPSAVLHRYVRQADGQVTLLQALYSSGVDTVQPSTTLPRPPPPTSAPTAPALGQCVVCLSAPVARVLLPCRHGCLCDQCFSKVSCCPVCRGHIAEYFRVAGAQPRHL